VGSVWLYDLPDVIDAAGLEVSTWDGWETRSRSSGGYDGLWAICTHHTASDASPTSDMNWMWSNPANDDGPVGAIYLARSGAVTVGAAGATNCQGKGGPWSTSRGTIPVDSGNRYALAIEAANRGDGEPWPSAQTDAYVELVAALVEWYGLEYGDVMSHWEWVAPPPTTGRKIDPAGNSPWATGAASWNMDAFRATVAGAPPPPHPNEGDDEVTDEDIERIVNAVWRCQINTKSGPANTASVLGWIYNATDDDELRSTPAGLE
jgi:N-acetylmuramoyl-L-alanine amidase